MVLTLEDSDEFHKEYLLSKESLYDSSYNKFPTACKTHSKPKSVLDFPIHNLLALLTHPIPKLKPIKYSTQCIHTCHAKID